MILKIIIRLLCLFVFTWNQEEKNRKYQNIDTCKIDKMQYLI